MLPQLIDVDLNGLILGLFHSGHEVIEEPLVIFDLHLAHNQTIIIWFQYIYDTYTTPQLIVLPFHYLLILP